MKRLFLIVSILSAGTVVPAQSYRSMSVWQGSSSTEFSLVAVDSVVMDTDGSLKIVTGSSTETFQAADIDSVTLSVPSIESTNTRNMKELIAEFNGVSINKNSYKPVGTNNPLMGHKFGADPFGMVDGDRVYVYMTDDHIYDSNGNVIESGYGDCKKVSVISSEDLVNWTDHGAQPVAGSVGGPATWANNMWAPCAAHKTINGKEKYFLYFADNANGIGVLTSDYPYGPWKQPSGMNSLISHSTPNCGGSIVPWLFDPAVMVDDDGNAYLYFGGGIEGLSAADPGSARCVQLGSNMISIVGEPKQIRPPYLFEDSGINKVGGKYIYSYCANFSAGGTTSTNPGSGNIGYMISDNPLGPFKYVGKCFDNPGQGWGGGGGNNHHAILEFKGKYYILYHTRTLKSAMRKENPVILDGMELRSTCISEINVDTVNHKIANLSVSSMDISDASVKQLKNFNPYQTVPGATMAWERGIETTYRERLGKYAYATAEAKKGSWMCISNVEFGQDGPIAFTAKVKGKGVIKVCRGNPTVNSGSALIALAEITSDRSYKTVKVPLVNIPPKTVSKLYIVFSDEASLESWSFIKEDNGE
jgi:arabinoxylan arabinofuranohydrolase